MASQSSVAARTDELPGSESFGNDLPAYRALSALAITSAIAGLLAGLSFVSWHWQVLAGLAVVAGVLADRRIRRMPDVLTGLSFAHAGIAMGLIFGVTSSIYGFWTTYTLKSAATSFARNFADEMNKAGSVSPVNTNDVLWYMIPPSIAKGISPEEAEIKLADMLKNSDKAKTINEMIKQMIRNAGPGNPITVANTEKIAMKEGEILVSVLLKVGDGRPTPKPNDPGKAKDDHAGHDEADHDHAKEDKDTAEKLRQERVMEVIGEGKEHALVLVHGTESDRKIRWYVDQIRYPYKPESFIPVVATKKADDDGHGHAH